MLPWLRPLFYFLFITSVIFLSCNEQNKIEIEKSAAAFDIKQGEASVLQSNQTFMKAFESKDSAKVSNCFTRDAKVMCANHPSIMGKENIRQYFSTLMKNRIAHISLHTIKIWGDSSILIEEGTYRFSDKEKEQIDKEKYIVL